MLNFTLLNRSIQNFFLYLHRAFGGKALCVLGLHIA